MTKIWKYLVAVSWYFCFQLLIIFCIHIWKAFFLSTIQSTSLKFIFCLQCLMVSQKAIGRGELIHGTQRGMLAFDRLRWCAKKKSQIQNTSFFHRQQKQSEWGKKSHLLCLNLLLAVFTNWLSFSLKTVKSGTGSDTGLTMVVRQV